MEDKSSLLAAKVQPTVAARKQETFRCQVETCSADLTDLKEYYLRYKICQKCQKLRSIIRDGKRQRFCQLCGRFHSIELFDGDKRSCRVRLAKHNERRRKQKADATSQGPSTFERVGSLGSTDTASNKKNRTVMESNDEQGKPASSHLSSGLSLSSLADSVRNPAVSLAPAPWPTEEKQVFNPLPAASQFAEAQQAASSGTLVSWGSGLACPRGLSGQASSPSLVSGTGTKPSVSSGPPTAAEAAKDCAAWSIPNMQHMQRLMPKYDWLPASVPHDIVNTPSLQQLPLPSAPDAAATSALDKPAPDFLNYILMPGSTVPGAQHGEQGQSGVDMHHFPSSVSNTLLDSWGMDRHPTSPSVEMAGALPWSCQPQQGSGLPHTSPVMPVLPPIPGVDLAMPAAPPEFSNPTFAALHTLRNPLDLELDAALPFEQMGSAGWGQHCSEGVQEMADSSMEMAEARSMINSTFQVVPGEVRSRFSAKISQISPQHLPRNLNQHLSIVVPVTMNRVATYVRTGCVFLTVAFGVDASEADTLKGTSLQIALNGLLSSPHAEFWRAHNAVIQFYNELVLIRGGRIVRSLDLGLSTAVLPCLTRVTPLAAKQGVSTVLTLVGRNLDWPGAVVARSQGQQCHLERLESSLNVAVAGDDAGSTLQVVLPPTFASGSLQIEISTKAYLTDFQVVMVMEDQDAVDELRQLECNASPGEANGFLLDLDRIVEFQRVADAVRSGEHVQAVYQEKDFAYLAKLAQRLFVMAIRKGWPAIARSLCGVASMQAASIVDVIQSMNSISPGLSLLHGAVCSGNPKMVEFVLEWTSAAGFELSAAARSPQGFTPLHLAALQNDDGKMAVTVTILCVDGKDAWKVPAKTLTAFDMAQLAQTADKIQCRLLQFARESEESLAAQEAAILKDIMLEDSDDAYSFTDSEEETASSHDGDCETGHDGPPVTDSKEHLPCSYWSATNSQGCSSFSGGISSTEGEVLAVSEAPMSLKNDPPSQKKLEVEGTDDLVKAIRLVESLLHEVGAQGSALSSHKKPRQLATWEKGSDSALDLASQASEEMAFGAKRSKARATLHGLLQESDSDDEHLQTRLATRGPFVWVPIFISAMCILLATLCKLEGPIFGGSSVEEMEDC